MIEHNVPFSFLLFEFCIYTKLQLRDWILNFCPPYAKAHKVGLLGKVAAVYDAYMQFVLPALCQGRQSAVSHIL